MNHRIKWNITIHLLLFIPALVIMPNTGLGEAIKNPHGPLNIDCVLCHSTDAWDVLRTDLQFDHRATTFPLEGQHNSVSCRECHADLVFSGISPECNTCHTDIHRGELGLNCAECHTPQRWIDEPRFRSKHQQYRLPLSGPHALIDCQSCHEVNNYANLSPECISCHLDQYENNGILDHAGVGFSTDCKQCHDPAQKYWRINNYPHTAAFPLTGGHSGTECSSCHDQFSLGDMPQECITCHRQQYDVADDPNHVDLGYPEDCLVCHAVTRWEDVQDFDHSLTDFDLTGAHIETDCITCHDAGIYNGLVSDCNECHLQNYQEAVDPIHAESFFSLDCEECHTTSDWQDTRYDHQQSTEYPLTGQHDETTCNLCHIDAAYDLTPSECDGCHLEDYNSSEEPNHLSAEFPTDCTICHTTNGWDDTDFDHDASDFPLTGAHLQTSCQECHNTGIYNDLDSDCYACHEEEYVEVESPDHQVGQFPQTCEDCHTTDSWEPSTFNHAETSFPLDGAHQQTECQNCHVAGDYGQLNTDCYQCHQEDYEGAENPEHAIAQFPTDCSECHTSSGWEPALFDHEQTEFPLTGRHDELDCSQCHIDGNFTDLPTGCYGCHDDDYAEADQPDHQEGQFPQDCTPCHSTITWSPSLFSHENTGFPLDGRHLSAACQQCHLQGDYSAIPSECINCHQDDYDNAEEPDHVAGQFPGDCTPCHSTSTWSPSLFSHENTGFQLDGRHLSLACQQCHLQGDYSAIPSECINCHRDDYDNAEEPDHVAGQFPEDCTQCHTTTIWSPAEFTHDQTDFPLTGAHQATPCQQCHTNGDFTPQPTECYACHEGNYQQAEEPNHVAAGFAHACEECHNTVAWTPAEFDHDQQTDFPLTGSHQGTECSACHIDDVYDGLPSQCNDCHNDDYVAAPDPDHVAAELPTTCEVCHTTTTWQELIAFDHDLYTSFALTGQHQEATCLMCHQEGYTGTDSNCDGCHLDDFMAADDPEHEAGAFDMDCSVCHSTDGWSPSGFNHDDQANYPLEGSHNGLDCNQCHANGQYLATQSNCDFCHLDDYNNANNHANRGYPLDCQLCHTITDWDDGEFNHDGQWFPIYTGSHHEAWDDCSDCHTDPNNFLVFTCIDCHEHREGETNDDHREVPGYEYNSDACYACHPDGRADDDFLPHLLRSPRHRPEPERKVK